MNTLIIPADDSLYITPSTYLILVQSTEFADDDTASYYIRYTTGDNPIILNDNVPHNDELENGEFAYYVFSFSSSHEDITIRLNA